MSTFFSGKNGLLSQILEQKWPEDPPPNVCQKCVFSLTIFNLLHFHPQWPKVSLFSCQASTNVGTKPLITAWEPPKKGRKIDAAQKSSRSVELFLTLVDDFWLFFALHKNCWEMSTQSLFWHSVKIFDNVSVALPAEPRGEKKTFFLCKFLAVKNF